MKKIGFIDYFLDEFHANEYPAMIKNITNDMEVTHAFALIDSPKEGGMTTDAWCEAKGITRALSIDKLIEECDFIVVLSPDNPEYHEELSEKPLMSGKRVYIDKTFAVSRESAARMFERAAKYNTQMYSTSALRFSAEFESVKKDGISFISSRGPASFETYAIHQFEPVVSLMGSDALRIMFVGNEISSAFQIEFSNGRKAITSHFSNECPFNFAIQYSSGELKLIDSCSGFFENFIFNMVDFFQTGNIKVPTEETMTISSLIECGALAKKRPGEWVNIR